MAKVKRKKGFFSRLKPPESYTSLILGALAVLIIGILILAFAKGNKILQKGLVGDSTKTENQKQNSNTSSAYTIKPGDDLWSISQDVYNDGYRWIEIAKANKLENPGVIHVGNKLVIPTSSITKTEPARKLAQETQATITQNNSITGTTYEIKKGDNLWDISVRAYADGYRWIEIARANNLENPDLIFSGNILKIPRS